MQITGPIHELQQSYKLPNKTDPSRT